MKRFFAFTTMLLISILFGSCGLFYRNDPAPPPYLPNRTEITSVRVSSYPNMTLLSSSEEIDFVLAILFNATPTKIESVNDTPNAEDLYGIQILAGESSTLFYLYKRERYLGLVTQWYIEQPYRGIYEISEEDANSLLNLL